MKHSETVTLASYQLAWNIAQAKKPYNEGEFIKKCLSDVEILSPENDKLKRMVSDIQLSCNNAEHGVSDINTAIESQLHSDLQECEYFSVALDESCEIQGKPQLAIFARSVSNDCVIKEELLEIVPLKDRTCGIDVKETMMAAFVKANLPIPKLTAVAMDGAPASKSLNLDNVMNSVMEIVNYICTHALNHRQFKMLIAELDQGLPGDLPLHCTVRWLSKGKVLSRFFNFWMP